MAPGRKRREVQEEHENHERWLVSWADFMTLLFAFFVVMYAVSRIDTKRVSEAQQSVRWAMHMSGEGGVTKLQLFDGPPSEGGVILDLSGGQMGTAPEQLVEQVRSRIERRIRPFVLQRPSKGPAAVSVLVEGRRVTVRLSASDFFDQGQSVLRPQVLPILDAIAAELVPLGRPIAVEGHTDETPVQGGRFRDNWDLSARRAATVVSYLQNAHAATPSLLSVVGRGDTQPIASGNDEAARDLNRRVELILELDVKEPRRARPQPPPAPAPQAPAGAAAHPDDAPAGAATPAQGHPAADAAAGGGGDAPSRPAAPSPGDSPALPAASAAAP